MSTLPPLPDSQLLLDEEPLLVLPRLVSIVGLNEAIVLQQVRYWLGDKRAPRVCDGRRWAVFTHEEWQRRNFPFWSFGTVERVFRNLERAGFLRSANYNQNRRNHMKWYTIDFDLVARKDAESRAILLGAPPARTARAAARPEP
ncbi:MAG: replication protein, partial [Chloroflexota bacterium]|nr:replication protein [Chloroflexota bacterium]